MLSDLHLHTYYSADGAGTPAAAFALATGVGARFVAFSEHNTIAHISPCLALESMYAGARYVPSVEVSCSMRGFGAQEIHVLLFFSDSRSRAWEHRGLSRLMSELEGVQAANLTRIAERLSIRRDIVDCMVRWCVDQQIVHESVPASRYHLKRYFQACGSDEFKRYKETGATAHRRLIEEGNWDLYPDIQNVASTAAEVGARWFLAHPWRYSWTTEVVEQVIDELLPLGLFGIETNYHPTLGRIAEATAVASKRGLRCTGGTDLHDVSTVTMEHYARMLEAIRFSSEQLAWLGAD